MRIITGKYKGKKLDYPKHKEFRPTKDRVKEGLFSAIQSHIENAKVLDLCCGTGSLGLEALSRGATHVTFIDEDIAYCKKNVMALGVERANSTIINKKLEALFSKSLGPFDVILFDPPWDDHDLYFATLNWIGQRKLLKETGIMICEKNKKVDLEISSKLEEIKRYHYGRSEVITLKPQVYCADSL